jgi:hypothetical protein
VWKHSVGASVAAVLVAGVVAGSSHAQTEEVLGARIEAEARVAAAQQVVGYDEALTLRVDAASADAAARRLVEQRAAEKAAREAAERAEAERVEAERVAAEQAAAAAAEAARAAAAAEAAAARTSSGKPAPKPSAPAAPTAAWRVAIVNSGGQEAVNACAGGLTRWFENVDGKPYYPIHRSCGGTPILSLHIGDRVLVDGAPWLVTDSRDVARGASYAAAAGLNGQILVQTCYRDPNVMRIVALTAA